MNSYLDVRPESGRCEVIAGPGSKRQNRERVSCEPPGGSTLKRRGARIFFRHFIQRESVVDRAYRLGDLRPVDEA